jgi:hypothetical protein
MAFTEQGVAMLSSVLLSKQAIQVNIVREKRRIYRSKSEKEAKDGSRTLSDAGNHRKNDFQDLKTRQNPTSND